MQPPLTPSSAEQRLPFHSGVSTADNRVSVSGETALRRFISLMRAPAVYLRMLMTITAFCVGCYLHYGSIKTTIYYGALCFLLIQIGYFCGVLYLVWKENHQRRIDQIAEAGPEEGLDASDHNAKRPG